MKKYAVKLSLLLLFVLPLLASAALRPTAQPVSAAPDAPNLQVTVNVPSSVTPGQTVQATITVTNAGATPATNVEIAGIVPQRTTHVSGGTPDTTVYTGYTYTKFPVIASLAPGANVQLQHSFQIPANATNGTKYNYEDVYFKATADGQTQTGFKTLNSTMTVAGGAPPPPTFQGEQIQISVNTVNPITAGGNYPITVQLRNTGTITGTNLLFSFPIPAGTTFVSGGTFIANYEFNSGDNFGPHTQTTITLNPSQSQTFVYTVTVPANPAVGTAYPVQTVYMEHTGGTRLRTVGVNASMLVEAAATVVASYTYNSVQFQTPLHGFGFQNFGNGTRNWQDDLLPADVFSLFGPGVCQTGNTAATCVLTTAAEQWRMNTLNGANGGHCEGMAVASIRLFEGRPFNGKTTPQDFGAPPGGTTVDLTLTPEMENYIMYYFASQYAGEVANAHWVNRKKPSEIVFAIRDGLNSGSAVGYTIGIYKPQTFAEGHAIIAVGVEQLQAEPHKYRILVYDNNYPKQRKYIEVDTQAETWRYSTAASPGNDPSAYTGTVDSKNLEYAPITIRELQAGQYYQCRFCNPTSGQRVPLAETSITITYMGEGEMLIVDQENGYQIGYDFASQTYTDTFATNGITVTVENLKVDPSASTPPRYTVPYTEGLYEVYIGAREAMSVTNGYLMVEGDGFIMGFDYIDLPDDGSTYRFQISPEGELIGIDVDASEDEDVVLPAMYLAYDPVDENEPSVVFQMDGLVLAGGELAVIRLDREAQRFYFETTDPYENFFDLQLTMVNSDGTTYEGETAVLTPANLDQFYVSYGTWDGNKIPVTLTRTFVSYLPLVVR